MSMTNKQFQGFVRMQLALLKEAAEKSPDNEKLKEIIDILQAMLEDGD